MIAPFFPAPAIVLKLGNKYLLFFFLNFSNLFCASTSVNFFLFSIFIQYKNLVNATPSSTCDLIILFISILFLIAL